MATNSEMTEARKTPQQKKLLSKYPTTPKSILEMNKTWSPLHEKAVTNSIESFRSLCKFPVRGSLESNFARRAKKEMRRRYIGQNADEGEDKENESSSLSPLKKREAYFEVPIQIPFDPHPLEDRPDSFYHDSFQRVFFRVRSYSQIYFGSPNLDKGGLHQPWAASLGAVFASYVQRVAAPDPQVGGWDGLLLNSNQRSLLVVAIISKVLETQVFGAELFGANPEEEKMLFAGERAFIEIEGFRRNIFRSQAIRTIIGSSPVTENFEKEVDHLTAQVYVLLKPLYDFLSTAPQANGTSRGQLPMTRQYQSLRNIIAEAAYLSIAIRLSPTIFHFSSPRPRDPFEKNEHCNVDNTGLIRSKKAVIAAQVRKYAWRQNNATGSQRQVRQQPLTISNLADNPSDNPRSYATLTKIAVWPSVRRYLPGSGKPEDSALPLEARDGYRVVEIAPACVVNYFGRRQPLQIDQITAEDWAKEKENLYGNKGNLANKNNLPGLLDLNPYPIQNGNDLKKSTPQTPTTPNRDGQTTRKRSISEMNLWAVTRPETQRESETPRRSLGGKVVNAVILVAETAAMSAAAVILPYVLLREPFRQTTGVDLGFIGDGFKVIAKGLVG